MSESTTNTETKQFLDKIGLDTLWNKICSIFASKSELNALSAGLKLTLSVSPTIIYKNTATDVTVTGTVKDNSGNVNASEIIIKTGNDILKTVEDNYTASHTYSVNTSSNVAYISTAVASGLSLSATTTLNARYPVYFGMGTSAENVKALNNKASARTSAVSSTTYDATASSNGVRFYLLVPNDVTRPSSFTMGGAPVDMIIPTTTEKLDNIDYYVFYTNATYNSGASVKIKAN